MALRVCVLLFKMLKISFSVGLNEIIAKIKP